MDVSEVFNTEETHEYEGAGVSECERTGTTQAFRGRHSTEGKKSGQAKNKCQR